MGVAGFTYPVINSGAVVSGIFPIRGAGPIGLWAPVITSANLFFQVGFTAVSAQMVRAFRPHQASADAGSHWVWAAGAGSAAVQVSNIIESFAFARIESGVAQADTRTLAVIQKA